MGSTGLPGGSSRSKEKQEEGKEPAAIDCLSAEYDCMPAVGEEIEDPAEASEHLPSDNELFCSAFEQPPDEPQTMQDCRRWPQDVPKLAQDGPKLAQDSPM